MIYRPVSRVFNFMSAPENDFQWQHGTLASARLSEDARATGTYFRSIGHLMGQRNLSTFEVIEYEPNQRYAFKSLSGPFQLQTYYTFQIAGRSTKINISTQADVMDFFKVDERVLAKKMKRQLKEDLAILKNLLETEQILSSPQVR
jgi:uncharacterized protein YndB with AHSA1/START domain